MKLRDLFNIIEEVRGKTGASPIFICGGAARDKVLNNLKYGIQDIDLTTGDQTIHDLARNLAIELGKKYSIKTKQLDDGHSTIYVGKLKLDFSSNFVSPSLRNKNLKDLQKEMMSRDFTMNGLLLSLDLKTIYDPTGKGIQDIKNKIIRTCLPPKITFTDNLNRIARVLYFAAKLNFEVDPEIIEWISANKQLFTKLKPNYLANMISKAKVFNEEKTNELIERLGLRDVLPKSIGKYASVPSFWRKNFDYNAAYDNKNYRNKELPPEVIEKFEDLARQQSGAPERAMEQAAMYIYAQTRHYFKMCLAISKDQLLKKYPEQKEAIEYFVSRAPGGNLKYTEWQMKVLLSHQAMKEEIADVIDLFDKFRDRLNKKDINQYQVSDFTSLRDKLFQLREEQRNRQEARQQKVEKRYQNEPEAIACGHKVIYDSDSLKCIQIINKAASIHYGLGTKWCITMKDQSYFEDYDKSNVVFFFLFNKRLDKTSPYYKIAFAYQRDTDNNILKLDIFDSQDNLLQDNNEELIGKYNNDAQDLLEIADIKRKMAEIAKSYPKSLLAKIYSDEIPVDEVIKLYKQEKNKDIQNTLGKWLLNKKVKGNIVISDYNGISYYKDGQLHREDGPAIENADGTKEWYRNGQRHREDGPAVEYANGDKFWFRNGQLHREDGPAVESANGGKEWYRNGQLHREDGPAIEHANGAKEWYRNGQLHREDGPAVERANGDKFWYRNGQRHREDGPAVEYANGNKEWFRNGQLHREDGPAIENANGDKFWFRNGQRHREDGPAVEQSNGAKVWHRNGQLHREDGPAVEYANGNKEWFRNGQLHREDGPAIEYANGNKEWYRNDKQLTETEFNNRINKKAFVFQKKNDKKEAEYILMMKKLGYFNGNLTYNEEYYPFENFYYPSRTKDDYEIQDKPHENLQRDGNEFAEFKQFRKSRKNWLKRLKRRRILEKMLGHKLPEKQNVFEAHPYYENQLGGSNMVGLFEVPLEYYSGSIADNPNVNANNWDNMYQGNYNI